MPTYEYACAACGHEWEEMQRITAAPIEVCPKCGASAAHRLISGGTNFILKGGGWYSDLYSSAKPGSKDSGTKDSASASTPSSDASKTSSGSDSSTSTSTATSGSSTPSSTPAASSPASSSS
jgi:putative FmdB family regulatory protein